MDIRRDCHRGEPNDRKTDVIVGQSQIRSGNIEVKTIFALGNAVRHGHAALVADLSAIIRILVAKAQIRTPGNGNERRHRRHHDGRRLSCTSTHDTQMHAHVIPYRLSTAQRKNMPQG